jgi:hypothetical protein
MTTFLLFEPSPVGTQRAHFFDSHSATVAPKIPETIGRRKSEIIF